MLLIDWWDLFDSNHKSFSVSVKESESVLFREHSLIINNKNLEAVKVHIIIIILLLFVVRFI